MRDRSWTLEQGLELVRALERELRPRGMFTGLTGSVLYKGFSEKDLDVIVAPLDSSRGFPIGSFHTVLTHDMGWKIIFGEAKIKQIWRAKGSADTKHVEAWLTPDGKRVDIFIFE